MKRNHLVPRGSRRIHNRRVIREIIAPKLGFDPYDAGQVSTSVGGDIVLTDVTKSIADEYRPKAEPSKRPWFYLRQLSDTRPGKSHRVAVYRIPGGWAHSIKTLVEVYGVDTGYPTVPINTFQRFANSHGERIAVIDLGFADT